MTARWRRSVLFCAACLAWGAEPILAEIISPDHSIVTSSPGATSSILLLLSENTTPLFGYSLDVTFVPQSGALGDVSANVPLTNFFDPRNIISAGGLVRDPIFSEIIGSGTGGVFISTNTTDRSTVLGTPGVNDVLAQVFFDVSADARGDFLIGFGPATALSGVGVNVSFSTQEGVIHVVPEPSSLVLLALTVVPFLAGRIRRSAG